MNKLEIESYLTREAIGLPNGTTTQSVECPNCSQSGSFSFTKEGDRLLYICHRASCGIAGTVRLKGDAWHVADSFRAPKPSPWQKELDHKVALPPTISLHLLLRYGLDTYTTKTHGYLWLPLFNTSEFNGRLWIPYWSFEGNQSGGTARSLERDSPKNLSSKGPSNHLGMDWGPVNTTRCDTVVLVEDSFSAARLRQLEVNAVSLNGTSLTEERVLELALPVYRHYVLALDGDAIKLALNYHFKYSHILPLEVKYIAKDIKDMNAQELTAVVDSLAT